MERTGKFITQDERENLATEQRCSGMFLSGGRPMGDPGAYVQRLTEKYGMPGCAVEMLSGEFVRP